MTFLEWVTQRYPDQFIPDKQFLLLRAAWDVGQAAERERIKKIIEQVGVQANHNEWFDCVDVILERI